MPATYEPIATTTLGSAVNNFTFSSIPATYTDLRLVIVVPTAATSGTYGFRFNGDTADNYSHTTITGDGSTAASYSADTASQITIGDMVSNSGVVTFQTIDVFSYAGSTNKTVLGQNSSDKNGTGDVRRSVGLWRNTAAITSITVRKTTTGNFPIGTTATLYGIKNA
jgi:hypothetical protein